MDNLNAQQIVLLTLLVSFVTSIATGITTVALLEQTPEPVTQTINRIVEKTVERVVSEPAPDNSKPAEKEIVTVVVKEEDLTIEAVEKNSKSLMRIYEKSGDFKTFVALGVIVSANGEVVTDTNKVVKGVNYVGVYAGGEFPLDVTLKEADKIFAILAPEQKDLKDFSVVNFTDSSNMKLGQSVISLSGASENTVSTGIITNLAKEAEVLKKIVTSVNSSNVLVGSIILNLKGEVVGIKVASLADETGSFVPANLIKEFLASRVTN